MLLMLAGFLVFVVIAWLSEEEKVSKLKKEDLRIFSKTDQESDSRDSQGHGNPMVSFPYYSHIFRDSYGNSMGPNRGPHYVPLLQVPENPTKNRGFFP